MSQSCRVFVKWDFGTVQGKLTSRLDLFIHFQGWYNDATGVEHSWSWVDAMLVAAVFKHGLVLFCDKDGAVLEQGCCNNGTGLIQSLIRVIVLMAKG